MSEVKKKGTIETTTLNPVPIEERKGWFTVALIQAGVMICVPTLMLGGLLVDGLSMQNAIIAGTMGFVIAVLIMVFMAVQGSDLGVPTVVCASSTFGKSGSRSLLSILFIVSLIGWFAVQSQVCGAAFSNLMSTAFGIGIPIWLSTTIWGVVMLITAVYGINALSILNYISVPALILISGYGAYIALKTKGVSILFNHVPPHPMTMIQGISLTVGFLVVGSVIAADYTRYQKTRIDSIKSSVLGIMPAGLAMVILGAIMSLVSGTYDITLVLSKLGVPILGAIVLILATWTTNTTNAYSAGIDIVMLFNLNDSKRAFVTMISGLLGTILGAIGIINYFEAFLNWSGYLFTPIAGVIIADYFIRFKGDPEKWHENKGFDIIAIVSWAVGSLISIIFTRGLPIVYGFLVSGLLYIGLKRIFADSKKINTELNS